jgi:hypothetical protein
MRTSINGILDPWETGESHVNFGDGKYNDEPEQVGFMVPEAGIEPT